MKKAGQFFMIYLLVCLLTACSGAVDVSGEESGQIASQADPTESAFVEEIFYVGESSARKYEAVYEYEKKPAEHLYVYTAAMTEKIRAALEEKYAPRTDRIGYLIPVFYPEHLNVTYQTYLCTIHRDGTEMTDYRLIQIDEAGNVQGLEGYVPRDIDFQLLAGYTSPETPMYLYFEKMNYFAVIGDKAYCFNNLPTMVDDGPSRTDSFQIYEDLAVRDVLRK